MTKNAEKRSLSDRRKRPTPVISKYTFIGGRRKTIRREADKRKYTFVDLFSTRLLIILLCILLFSHIDAYLTLTLIEKGSVVESNPLMAFFLDHSTSSFILTKFFITAVSLILLCLFKNLYITKIGLPFLIITYLSLIIYELYLVSLLSA